MWEMCCWSTDEKASNSKICQDTIYAHLQLFTDSESQTTTDEDS
jgi:hypothetical protein